MDEQPSHDGPTAVDRAGDGLASVLLGGFSIVTPAIGLVFNLVLAAVGRSVMRPFDVRLHAVGTLVVLLFMVWLTAQGLRLSRRGRGGLTAAGRVVNMTALVFWLLFALGETFVIGGLW